MNRPRSVLFLPASNLRAIAKARTLPCDAVVLDLEDAVAPEQKEMARAQAIAAVREGGFGARQVVVRINGFDTPWGEADAAALRDVPVDALLLPKVEEAAWLAQAGRLAGQRQLWAMIETPRAVLALGEISRAGIGLTTLVAGVNDLSKALRCRPDATRAPLLTALSLIVLAARAHDLIALDGVCNVLDDPERLATECGQGAMLGFDGKTLIHPSHIDAANAAFGPTAQDIAWAEAVVAAFDDPANADKGAVRLNGAMVERLHLAEAGRVLASR